jgi:transcriptional regulator with XRE-family HTH domain
MYKYILPRPLPQVECKFLKEERLRRKWTQEYVNVQHYIKFGVSLSGKLSLIEKGDDKVWEPMRQRLSVIFEMPEHELFPELYEYATKVPMNGETAKYYG